MFCFVLFFVYILFLLYTYIYIFNPKYLGGLSCMGSHDFFVDLPMASYVIVGTSFSVFDVRH